MCANRVKASEAREEIRAIVSGLAPGEKLPPVRELTRKVSASHVTIFSALKALERAGEVYSIPRKGFYRSSRTRSNRLATIGVLFRFGELFLERIPYAQKIMRGVKGRVASADSDLLFMSYRRDIHSPAMDAAEIRARSLSGLIVLEVESPKAIAGLLELDFPVVFIEADLFGFGHSAVVADEGGAMSEWCREMAGKGARRFLYAARMRRQERNHEVPGIGADTRLAVLRTSLNTLGGETDIEVVYCSEENAGETVEGRIASLLSDEIPTAVVDVSGLVSEHGEKLFRVFKYIKGVLKFSGTKPVAGLPCYRLDKPFQEMGAAAVSLIEAQRNSAGETPDFRAAVSMKPGWSLVQAGGKACIVAPAVLTRL